ncbi:MAG: hypothetical protein K2P64_11275 [Lachnospiraceae bacterium]|nr:hypothetical protein [Lachnospiraceae bacterium]
MLLTNEDLLAISRIVDSRLKPIKKDITELKEDILILKEDVYVLKDEVSIIKRTVADQSKFLTKLS